MKLYLNLHPHSLISFEHFLQGDYLSLAEKLITNHELNEALQTIKTKKSSGYDDVWSSDVIKYILPSVFETLRHIFNLLIEKGIFPDQLKIVKVTLLFKKGDNSLMDNSIWYKSIFYSINSLFYKSYISTSLLERTIYNRLYSFFSENNILYKNKFGFQKQYSTDHAIVHLVNEILKPFGNNCHILGVFLLT